MGIHHFKGVIGENIPIDRSRVNIQPNIRLTETSFHSSLTFLPKNPMPQKAPMPPQLMGGNITLREPIHPSQISKKLTINLISLHILSRWCPVDSRLKFFWELKFLSGYHGDSSSQLISLFHYTFVFLDLAHVNPSPFS